MTKEKEEICECGHEECKNCGYSKKAHGDFKYIGVTCKKFKLKK